MKKLLFAFIFFIFCAIDVKAYVIPKLYIDGNIENMNSKSDIRKVKISYESEDLTFSSYATLKIQGNWSLRYDKKNYTIKLYKDELYEEKNYIDVLWGKQYEYCLKANWIDKTHSRNIVTANIVSDINKKYDLFINAPNYGAIGGFPIEIYENNKFLGLYTFNIPKDAWLFNMDKKDNNNIILTSEDWFDSNLLKSTKYLNKWSIETGPEDNTTYEKLKRLIKFIVTSSDKEFKNNINKYIDLDATLNYFIMCEFANLYDNVGKNMLLVTYDGNYWYPALYDLDSSFGTTYDGMLLDDYNYIDRIEFNLLYNRILKNFSKEYTDRYFELRKEILTKENIMEKFTEFSKKIPDETLNLEKNKWENLLGYDIEQIEEYLNERIPVLDDLMRKRKYDYYKNNIYFFIPIITIGIITIVGALFYREKNKLKKTIKK